MIESVNTIAISEQINKTVLIKHNKQAAVEAYECQRSLSGSFGGVNTSITHGLIDTMSMD